MAAEVVNLNRARKARARAEEAAAAAENRVRHGRSRADREKDAAVRELADRLHAAHRREEPPR